MVAERHLLESLRAGNVRVLDTIYDRYRDRLLAFAKSLSPDPHLAEDMVQDVFVCFFRNANKLELKGSLYSYLCAGVRNAVRDLLRRRSRVQNHLKGSMPISETEVTIPEDLIDLTESGERLHQCLKTLPTEQRDVVVWRTYQDLPFDEIAKRQGTCSSTARGRYRYGIGKLGDLMRCPA